MGYGAHQTGHQYNVSPAVWVSTAEPTPPSGPSTTPPTQPSTEHTVSVNYIDDNGATIKDSPSATTVADGASFSIPNESIPTIPGYSYALWRDGSTAMTGPISLVSITEDKTVNLVYSRELSKVIVTVRYLDGNGTPIGKPDYATYAMANGVHFMLPASYIPTIPGYAYHEWRDPQGQVWSSGTAVKVLKVTTDITVDLVYGRAGALTISKTVDSVATDDKAKDFTFTASFTDSQGQPLSQGTFTYAGGASDPSVTAPPGGTLTLDAEGKATFTLKHGQSVEIQQIPPDLSAQVVETEDHAFVTSSALVDMSGSAPVHAAAGDTGPIVMGTDGAGWLVSFTNTREMPVPSGIGADLVESWWLLLIVVVLAGAGFASVTWKRRRPWTT
jgi:hypothetical protein